MKRVAVFLAFQVTILATVATSQAPEERARSQARHEAEAMQEAMKSDVVVSLQAQAAQWTAGDLEGFCSHYTDDAVFLSPSGLTRGRAEVFARYKKKYGTDKASMGALTFEILDVRGVQGPQASVALRYTLTWPNKPAATGLSLVVLTKTPNGWQIAQDASM
jgi:uncharacterized protein (TIGR02246 family)